jgi:hypothetical protein
MDEERVEAFLLVFLGIHTVYEEDLQLSTAKLVYSEPLRVSGEFIASTTCKVEPSVYLQLLCSHMNQLRSTPAA